mmetsp:Transcript_36942/g.47102  ORF Transcript_36942/g.47102 Transcript_36942/m.47102 type:complete len:170 (+) Transcript_36942:54-563(+)
MDAAKRLLGRGNEPEEKRYEDMDGQKCECCPSMPWEWRVGGCAFCVALGFVLSMGSAIRVVKLIKGDPLPFVLFYTMGNLVSLSSSFFLSGPFKQIKKMFHKSRIVATVVYLSTLGLTLFVAFTPGVPLKGPLILLLLIVQFCALVWYNLSYIPYARKYMKECCKTMCC